MKLFAVWFWLAEKKISFAMYGVVYVEQIFLFSFETCHSIWATANKRVVAEIDAVNMIQEKFSTHKHVT